MQFRELLSSAGVKAEKVVGDCPVDSVQADSRKCTRGACFVAVRGYLADGHDFIRSAVLAGASAVVCESADAIPDDLDCAWAVVDDTRDAIGKLAQEIHGRPADKLTCIAITGTNGKTTVAHLIRGALESCGKKTAMLGTISYDTGQGSIPALTTTPGPVELAEMTADMVAAGVTHLVMELSSHALHQRRTEGINFRVGVFTNLSGDHLDYHGTMDEYRAAKCLLFDSLGEDDFAVINQDDSAGAFMADKTRANVMYYRRPACKCQPYERRMFNDQCPIINFQVTAKRQTTETTTTAYGRDGCGTNDTTAYGRDGGGAEIIGRVLRADVAGTVFSVDFADGTEQISTGLIGVHNVYNCLAAFAVCESLGFDRRSIADGIASVNCVPGRLERVASELPFAVFIDYAHTDDALENVLTSLRTVAGQGDIIVVFGCGGDRDRTKRPRMARVAEKFADRIIITSDNPRSEDPQRIIDEIIAGLTESGRTKMQAEPNRRRAIAMAIESARAGDIVLVAGKGHETYQIIGDEKLDFDDAQEVKTALAKLGDPR